MTGVELEQLNEFVGVRERYSPCKQLRATLYGETTLCQDERRQKQLVVLKRVSLTRLRANAEHARENPARERDVIDVLRKNGGHAHVVRYDEPLAMFVHDDSLFIVMEYCAGGDLYDYVCGKPTARLHEIEALRLFYQVASGVQFLHAHGIAHRDLSLENVLLHASGSAKICDFGLSTDAHMRCHDAVGKLYYMAPEVVACGTATATAAAVITTTAVSSTSSQSKQQQHQLNGYDPMAADVWSLGILLFILLTGSPLISDETPGGRAATLKVLQQRNGGVAAILAMWDLAKLMAPATVELLSTMLQVDATKRASIEQVLAHPALRLFDKA